MIDQIAKVDQGKRFISTNTDGQIQAFYVPDLQYSVLGKFIIFRLKEDRDVKIVITGKGKTTGTGKTTLAIHLARFVNKVRNHLFGKDTDWQAKEYSFMNVWEYLKKYEAAEAGDPLVTDELEHMFDNRRSMSNQNKYGTEAWSVLRYKNAVTIGTAPGLSDVDKRIPEGADIWINVIHKGCANVYYLTVDDFEWRPIYRRLRIGGYRESILWNPIEDDEDYRWLKQAKEDIGVPGIGSEPGQPDRYDESDLNQLEKDIRNAHVKRTLLMLADMGFYNEDTGQFERFTQSKIASLCEVSQAQVSKIKRDLESDGEL